MAEIIQAYPLQWPHGWRRHNGHRVGGKFTTYKRSLSLQDGTTRVLQQLDMMNIRRDDVVISTNVKLRLDGLPRSDQPQPVDPGAAVYWRAGSVTRCIAIDQYTWVQDNLAAIAATLEAMRAIKRHGGAEILDRAFMGFTALEGPRETSCWEVLEIPASSNRAAVEQAYRRLAMKAHPDREGGSTEAFQRLSRARDQALSLADP